MTDKMINAIMHYVNCTREDAKAMHYGVRKVRDDYYSAFMEDGIHCIQKEVQTNAKIRRNL